MMMHMREWLNFMKNKWKLFIIQSFTIFFESEITTHNHISTFFICFQKWNKKPYTRNSNTPILPNLNNKEWNKKSFTTNSNPLNKFYFSNNNDDWNKQQFTSKLNSLTTFFMYYPNNNSYFMKKLILIL
jgi:hypothetical protein